MVRNPRRRSVALAGCLLLALLHGLALAVLLPPGVEATVAGTYEPPVRTPIKINGGPTTTSSTSGSTYSYGSPPSHATSSSANRGSSRYTSTPAAPVLHREPNAVVPPPFLQSQAVTDGAAVATPSRSGDAAFDRLYAASEGEPNAGLASPPRTTTDDQNESDGDFSLGGGVLAGSPVVDDNAPAAASSEASSSAAVVPHPTWSSSASTWTALAGQCFSYNSAQYTYSFCPFHNVTQKSTSSSLHVVLGVWDHWEDVLQSEPQEQGATESAQASSDLAQLFTDGTACASGKRRRCRVLFECEPLERMTRVSDVQEPATCEYTLLFHTPLVCDQALVVNTAQATRAARAAALAEHAAVATGASSSSSAADRAVIRAMQACIDALLAEVELEDPSNGAAQRAQAHSERTCADFLPGAAAAAAQANAAAAEPSSSSTVANLAGGAAAGAADAPVADGQLPSATDAQQSPAAEEHGHDLS